MYGKPLERYQSIKLLFNVQFCSIFDLMEAIREIKVNTLFIVPWFFMCVYDIKASNFCLFSS
ncbi:hypothetical protein YC2023_033928 [Brassica napus]